MALMSRRTQFSRPKTAFERQLVPVLSVLLASLAPLLPTIASVPLLPPLGLMMLIGWRLLRIDLWPAWAALALGLFDDLFSGQPLGSAMALWTIMFLIFDFVDTRLIWRDHAQDWGLAVVAMAGVLTGGWGLAELTGGATPLWLLGPQIIISALLFPLVARACATLDRWRSAR
jgi:rod shape-determining protein MreD